MSDHSVRLSDSMSTPAGAAMEYHKLRWEPIRLPPRKKSPAGKWKEPRKWTEAEIHDEFSDDSNVGLALVFAT